MKWITLNDGSLVNLERVSHICVATWPTIEYHNTDVRIVEMFKDNAEAIARMEYLRKLLTAERK